MVLCLQSYGKDALAAYLSNAVELSAHLTIWNVICFLILPSSLATFPSYQQGANIGTFVFQVDATDVDADLNAALSYTITGGNTGEVFSISSDDGRVTVKTPPDRENELGSINSYTVSDYVCSLKPNTYMHAHPKNVNLGMPTTFQMHINSSM